MSDRIQASTQSGATITGPFISESLNEGTENRYKAVGTRAQCEAQRQIWRAQRASRMELEPNGDGQWQLNASFAGLPSDEGGAEAEVPTNLHELETTAEQGDYRSNYKLTTLFSADGRAIVLDCYERYLKDRYADDSDYIRPDATVQAAWASLTPVARARADINRLMTRASIGAPEIADGQGLFSRLVAGGGELVYTFNSIYRRTITAASSSQVRAAYTGVGQIWTSGEVESFEGIPTSQWFGLPTTYWLKLPPRVTASAGGKTDIEYTYQGGFYYASAFFYTAYGSATLLDA